MTALATATGKFMPSVPLPKLSKSFSIDSIKLRAFFKLVSSVVSSDLTSSKVSISDSINKFLKD